MDATPTVGTTQGRIRKRIAIVLAMTLVLSLVESRPADMVPPGGVTGNMQGRGFDRCEAPTASNAQTWWSNSPYWYMGSYIGGSNASCGAPSPSHVSTLNDQGWGFLPIWVGPQAPSVCQFAAYNSYISTDPTVAVNQGKSQADAAAAAAIGLGFAAGTVIYYDIEGWDTGNATCNTAVHEFLNGWVFQLRTQHSMKAGIYGSACSSNSPDWATLPNQPDAVWLGWSTALQTVWNIVCTDDAPHRNLHWPGKRIHQHNLTHNETYGGVTLDIDSDCADGITAAHFFSVKTNECPLRNDFFAVPVGIAMTGTDYGNTTSANVEISEPQPCGGLGSTVWYTITQPTTGRTVVTTISSETRYDTVLAIYSGSSLAGLSTLDCNDDSDGGTQSRASANMLSNTAYRIQVGGFNGAIGSYGLTTTSATYGASWWSQSYPTTMTSGQVASAFLEYRNDSNYVWTPTTRVGTQNPRDVASPFADATWIANNRPASAPTSCYPGTICRFTFNLRAPTVFEPVAYTLYWGLLQEGETWFGPPDGAVWFQITVNP